MKVPPTEVLDRFTIVKLKSEKIGGKDIQRELEEYEEAIEDFRKIGVVIKQEWIDRLYEGNGAQWDLENKMRKAKDNGPDLMKMGRLHIEIQKLNKKRTAVKNEIAEATEMGFRDIDVN